MTNLIVGALIGFASAFLLRSWQYRRDLWLKRVEVLCAVLDSAAEAGTEYWLKDHSPDSIKTEARIMGLQARIDGMFAGLELDKVALLLQPLSAYRDSLTGGDFGGAVRVADPDRARLIQMYASDLIVAVWAAAYDHLSFASWQTRRKADLATCKVWFEEFRSRREGR